MNYRARLFLDELVALTNKFDDLPFEVRRLVIESVMHLVEVKADEAIIAERPMDVDIIIDGGEENAENILKDKLGELPEREHSAQ